MTDTSTVSALTEGTFDLNNEKLLPILESLPQWGKLTTIVIHGGSVFEYKGEFPKGSVAEGYYNLSSNGTGFEGHLRIDKLNRLQLVTKKHRGRISKAIVFSNNTEAIFKVFLGRDENGDIFKDQITRFEALAD